MAGEDKLSDKARIGEAVTAGFRFWRTGVRLTPGVLVLAGAAGAFLMHVSPPPGVPAAPADIGRILGAQAAYFLVSLLAQAALYRAAFAQTRPDEPDFKVGPLGFQFGKVELSALGAILLCALGLTVLFAVILVALTAAVPGLRSGVPATPDGLAAALASGGPMVLLGMIVLLVVLIWVSLRLALVVPASAAERGVRVLSAWKLTRGHVWHILGAQLLVFLPTLGLAMIGGSIITAALASPSALQPHFVAIARILYSLAVVFYALPVSVGTFAYFYERLAATRPPAETRV